MGRGKCACKFSYRREGAAADESIDMMARARIISTSRCRNGAWESRLERVLTTRRAPRSASCFVQAPHL